MLYNNFGFKSMEYSLDALWIKQKLHSNNIANHDTPGFKTQSLSFKDILEEAGSSTGATEHRFEATITTDENSVRPDGNNVNLEKESLELYKTYAQSAALYEKIGVQFKNTRYVINQMLK